MKNLVTVSKQYILLAIICPKEKEKKITPFDAIIRLYPAYVKIRYFNDGFEIKYKDEVSHLCFKDIEQIKISICGRRASVRQHYLLTLRVTLTNNTVLEIETYDYDDGIKFFELVKENGVKNIEENNVIELIKKYENNIEGLYRYISSNTKNFFKDHPYDERRLDYLLENRTKYHKPL